MQHFSNKRKNEVKITACNLIRVIQLTRTILRKNSYFTIIWIFMRFARNKLDRLLKNQPLIKIVPDAVFENIAKEYCNVSITNLTYENCALTKFNNSEEKTSKNWHCICSKTTYRKYKVFIAPCKNCLDGEIIVSETMWHNVKNALGHYLKEESYFVMPVEQDAIPIAAEAKISMLSSSYDCSTDFIDSLLKAYFLVPRYAQHRDILAIDTKKYAPQEYYTSLNCESKVFFRVNSLSIKSENGIQRTNKGCYIVKGETSLVQCANISAYVPPTFSECPKKLSDLPVDLQIEISALPNCPPPLEIPLSHLETCISPFLQEDVRLKIRPVFLVKGLPGCGKYRLIECLARRKGLNLLSVDFSEIQCASASQTEAKLRIILQNAQASAPCILRLSNVQTFGKNSEGKKDERVVSAFASELEKLNDKRAFPVIVIATLEDDELEADVERLFIETISIEHPEKSERAEALSWFLKTKGLSYQGDLANIAGSFPNFELVDFETLVAYSSKICYKNSQKKEEVPLTLSDEHFLQACELMQSLDRDRIGAPKIPKVYWDDIGGLASLKHEIKRRIELPMLNTMGLGKSGLLLHGPPGTGKTLLAKAVATECQLHFMSVKGPELLNMYVGQSEKNIRQVFESARAAAPCVIFFDELDSLAPNRGRSGDSGGVMDRVVSQLLAEMDGLESSGKVFVIAATNRLDLIDPALLRPGRFDKLLYVGIYDDRDSQLSVLRALTRRFRLRENGNELEKLVEKLPKNLTGADLYSVCSDAWLFAVRRRIDGSDVVAESEPENEVTVHFEDFLEAVTRLVPSLSPDELSRYKNIEMEFSSKR